MVGYRPFRDATLRKYGCEMGHSPLPGRTKGADVTSRPQGRRDALEEVIRGATRRLACTLIVLVATTFGDLVGKDETATRCSENWRGLARDRCAPPAPAARSTRAEQ